MIGIWNHKAGNVFASLPCDMSVDFNENFNKFHHSWNWHNQNFNFTHASQILATKNVCDYNWKVKKVFFFILENS